MIPLLEQQFGREIILSTSTQTGMDNLRKQFPDRRCLWFPFDRRAAVHRFLANEQPAAVILLELEIWPQFILACKQRHIPSIILNGRVSQRSFQGYRKLGLLLRPIFSSITCALAQNELWAKRLQALGAPQVVTTGSLKASMVRLCPAEEAEAFAQQLGLSQDKPIFLIASTSGDEEKALLESWQQWGRKNNEQQSWQCVVAPRHPNAGKPSPTWPRISA